MFLYIVRHFWQERKKILHSPFPVTFPDRFFCHLLVDYWQFKGSSGSIIKIIRREIFAQGKVWKTQIYVVYFKFSEPQHCGKRSGEGRR